MNLIPFFKAKQNSEVKSHYFHHRFFPMAEIITAAKSLQFTLDLNVDSLSTISLSEIESEELSQAVQYESQVQNHRLEKAEDKRKSELETLDDYDSHTEVVEETLVSQLPENTILFPYANITPVLDASEEIEIKTDQKHQADEGISKNIFAFVSKSKETEETEKPVLRLMKSQEVASTKESSKLKLVPLQNKVASNDGIQVSETQELIQRSDDIAVQNHAEVKSMLVSLGIGRFFDQFETVIQKELCIELSNDELTAESLYDYATTLQDVAKNAPSSSNKKKQVIPITYFISSAANQTEDEPKIDTQVAEKPKTIISTIYSYALGVKATKLNGAEKKFTTAAKKAFSVVDCIEQQSFQDNSLLEPLAENVTAELFIPIENADTLFDLNTLSNKQPAVLMDAYEQDETELIEFDMGTSGFSTELVMDANDLIDVLPEQIIEISTEIPQENIETSEAEEINLLADLAEITWLQNDDIARFEEALVPVKEQPKEYYEIGQCGKYQLVFKKDKHYWLLLAIDDQHSKILKLFSDDFSNHVPFIQLETRPVIGKQKVTQTLSIDNWQAILSANARGIQLEADINLPKIAV